MARGWPESASKKRKRAHRTSPIHSDALATCSPLAASRHRRGTTEAAIAEPTPAVAAAADAVARADGTAGSAQALGGLHEMIQRAIGEEPSAQVDEGELEAPRPIGFAVPGDADGTIEP